VDVNTGAMVSCKDAAANAGVNGVLATAFGLEGIVLDEVNKIAYLSSFGGTPNLYECKFDDKGIFTSCGISVVTSPANYAGSYGMVARNTAQNLLYVVSTDNALITVLACPIDDNGVVSGNCTNTGAPISSAAVQIALNSQNSVAYVGSYSDNYVTVCDVSADGFSFINCVNKTGDNGSVSFIQPAGVALNNTGSMIYVAEYNFSGGNVYACSTTPNGNATYFDSCTPVATGLFNLNGIALDGPNTTAYIANFGSVYVCRINGDGTFAPCTTNSDVPGAVNVTISN
jgi:6-phosphogluconolactonase (cycloisomerase 2 family)